MDVTSNNSQVNPQDDTQKSGQNNADSEVVEDVGSPTIDPDVKLSMGNPQEIDDVPIEFVQPNIPPIGTTQSPSNNPITNDPPLSQGNTSTDVQSNATPTFQPPPQDPVNSDTPTHTPQPTQPTGNPAVMGQSMPSSVANTAPPLHPDSFTPPIEDNNSAQVQPTTQPAQQDDDIQVIPPPPSNADTNESIHSNSEVTTNKDEAQLTAKTYPEDLDLQWNSWKCLSCNYVYEGQKPIQQCPRCGNDDPDKFD